MMSAMMLLRSLSHLGTSVGFVMQSPQLHQRHFYAATATGGNRRLFASSSSEPLSSSTSTSVVTSSPNTIPAPAPVSTASPSKPSTSSRPYDVILYDGVCNFCNTWVDILLRIDTQEKFRFAPLQSSVGKELLVAIGKEADDISSVVLVKANSAESYDKSQCVLKVVQELGPVASVASQAVLRLVPARLRDGIYDTVASNRYKLMGKRDECRCADPKFAHRFLLD
jgi:predicted DCC family thiol-disulfide oxidoreductase YuxK